jgi:hypothetical protein
MLDATIFFRPVAVLDVRQNPRDIAHDWNSL